MDFRIPEVRDVQKYKSKAFRPTPVGVVGSSATHSSGIQEIMRKMRGEAGPAFATIQKTPDHGNRLLKVAGVRAIISWDSHPQISRFWSHLNKPVNSTKAVRMLRPTGVRTAFP